MASLGEDSLTEDSLTEDTALLLAAQGGYRPPRRRTSPLVVLAFVVLAAAGALATGLLLLSGPGDVPRPAVRPMGAVGLPESSPLPSRSASPSTPPASSRAPEPSPSVFVVATPAPSPAPSPAPPAPVLPAPVLPLSLMPSRGGNGAELLVLGTGWTPGTTVTLDYLGLDGEQTGAQASAVVDPQGGFGVELLAEDPADRIGQHVVRVTDGIRTQDVAYLVE